jgi:hypothetical protein
MFSGRTGRVVVRLAITLGDSAYEPLVLIVCDYIMAQVPETQQWRKDINFFN